MMPRNDRNIIERRWNPGWRGCGTSLAKRPVTCAGIDVQSVAGGFHGLLRFAPDLDQLEWILAANPQAVVHRDDRIDDRKTYRTIIAAAKIVQSNRPNSTKAPRKHSRKTALQRRRIQDLHRAILRRAPWNPGRGPGRTFGLLLSVRCERSDGRSGHDGPRSALRVGRYARRSAGARVPGHDHSRLRRIPETNPG